jgi:hypothetical protein
MKYNVLINIIFSPKHYLPRLRGNLTNILYIYFKTHKKPVKNFEHAFIAIEFLIILSKLVSLTESKNAMLISLNL